MKFTITAQPLGKSEVWTCECGSKSMCMAESRDFRRGRVVKMKCNLCSSYKYIVFYRSMWFKCLAYSADGTIFEYDVRIKVEV